MNTSELTGAALDWAVAKCEELNPQIGKIVRYPGTPHQEHVAWYVYVDSTERDAFEPSTNWAQGGPIIDQEGISIGKGDKQWAAFANADDEEGMLGTTSLIAAMRCYVASKLGDTVDVPTELI